MHERYRTISIDCEMLDRLECGGIEAERGVSNFWNGGRYLQTNSARNCKILWRMYPLNTVCRASAERVNPSLCAVLCKFDGF